MDLNDTQIIAQPQALDEDEMAAEDDKSKPAAYLQVLENKHVEKTVYPLFAGENVIGRDKSSTVCIKSQTLSKQHAIISIKKGGVFCIYDVGSLNKTKKSSCVLKPGIRYELQHEEIIVFADIECRFNLPETKDSNSENSSDSLSYKAVEKENSEDELTQEPRAEFAFDQYANGLTQPQQVAEDSLLDQKEEEEEEEGGEQEEEEEEEEEEVAREEEQVVVLETPAIDRRKRASNDEGEEGRTDECKKAVFGLLEEPVEDVSRGKMDEESEVGKETEKEDEENEIVEKEKETVDKDDDEEEKEEDDDEEEVEEEEEEEEKVEDEETEKEKEEEEEIVEKEEEEEEEEKEEEKVEKEKEKEEEEEEKVEAKIEEKLEEEVNDEKEKEKVEINEEKEMKQEETEEKEREEEKMDNKDVLDDEKEKEDVSKDKTEEKNEICVEKEVKDDHVISEKKEEEEEKMEKATDEKLSGMKAVVRVQDCIASGYYALSPDGYVVLEKSKKRRRKTQFGMQRRRKKKKTDDESTPKPTTRKKTNTDEPKEVTSDEPKEITSDEPKEVTSDEPNEVSSDEPKEVTSDDRTKTEENTIATTTAPEMRRSTRRSTATPKTVETPKISPNKRKTANGSSAKREVETKKPRVETRKPRTKRKTSQNEEEATPRRKKSEENDAEEEKEEEDEQQVTKTPEKVKKRRRSSAKKSRDDEEAETVVKNPKIMFTGGSDRKIAMIVNSLGGSIVDSIDECTHLISDKIRRTVKLLCTLSKGFPIVTAEWIYASQRKGHFLDPWPYLVQDRHMEQLYKFSLIESLKKASDKPLFANYTIHVTESVLPGPEEMTKIIQCGGGRFLNKLPLAAGTKKAPVLIISCPEDLPVCSRAIRNKIKVVDKEMLLTGVLRQEFDVDDYLLTAL